MTTMTTKQRAMQELGQILHKIKSTEWEKMTKAEILTYRAIIAVFKAKFGFIRPLLVSILFDELKKHAKDRFAINLFKHYLSGAGKRYTVPLAGMKYINSNSAGLSPMGPIDLRLNDYGQGGRSDFITKCRQVKRDGKKREYQGRTLRVWDNGAIATYTVAFKGHLVKNGAGCEWVGEVQFYDRFDLDPRWGWSPSNPQGRSAGGERRTRIGYILDLGWNFDIYSVIANATQGENDSAIDFGQRSNVRKKKSRRAGDAKKLAK